MIRRSKSAPPAFSWQEVVPADNNDALNRHRARRYSYRVIFLKPKRIQYD